MPSTDNEGREGIELLSSGAIRVWIDGSEHKLRRPRVREFRQLRETLQDALDDISALADEVDRAQRAMADEVDDRVEKGGDSLTLEERKANRDRGRELTTRREELLLAWWAKVGELLCESTAWPVVDEMPVWMGATESSTELVTHWRSVPSLSGVR